MMMFASENQRDARNWQVQALGLEALTADPAYIKDGYMWFRDDINMIFLHLDGANRGIALLGLDGKILDSQVPNLALGDTFVVGSQAAMLALSAQKGDIAIRTDLMASFILTVSAPTILGNWLELVGANSAPVQSVNSQIGNVVLTTSDIAEGTNLYFTQAHFDTSFATKSTTHLAEGTNLYYTDARFDTRFAAKSTTNLVEGANLYYTQARFDLAFSMKNTGDLSEGSNLYYTDARFDTRFGTKTTTNLSEGTNLYFTGERVDDRVAALIQDGDGIEWTYNDLANTLTADLMDGAIGIGKLSDFYPYSGGALTLNVSPGRVRDDNTVTDKLVQVLALANNNTSYVEIDSLGVATANLVGFTAGSIPVALVVTLSGAITSITDKRTWISMGGGGGGGGGVPSTSGQQYYSDEFAATIAVNWDNGNVQRIVLANGAQVITLTNPKPGARYTLILKQPASGAAGTVTWPASVSWPSGVTPTLTVTNGKVDNISFVYEGTDAKHFGSYGLNY